MKKRTKRTRPRKRKRKKQNTAKYDDIPEPPELKPSPTTPTDDQESAGEARTKLLVAEFGERLKRYLEKASEAKRAPTKDSKD